MEQLSQLHNRLAGALTGVAPAVGKYEDIRDIWCHGYHALESLRQEFRADRVTGPRLNK